MKKIRISAVTAGIIIATVAVAAQVIFGFSHPEAYGVCLVCHGRDMLAQLYQTVFHKAMDMSVYARSGPVLTVIGILAGAFIGAVSSGEFRWQWVEGKFASFLRGIVVAICALIISGCPMRLMIRSAYGDVKALLGIIALMLGCVVGTLILKKRSRRKD